MRVTDVTVLQRTVDGVRSASDNWNFPRHNVAIFSMVIWTNGNDISLQLVNVSDIEDTTPFHPNFRGINFGLECRCCGSEERRAPKTLS